MNFESLDIKKIIKNPVDENLLRISRHINRYHAAIKALDINDNDFVIDASCGYGYGSYILRQKARKIYGLDIEQCYLESAKKNFNEDLLHFANYQTFKSLINYMGKANKLVCIETFEHIEKENVIAFVEMILNFISQNGSLFITTPLGNNKPCSHNEHHLNEPSIDFLYDMFANEFKRLDFNVFEKQAFGQTKKECYLTLIGKK